MVFDSTTKKIVKIVNAIVCLMTSFRVWILLIEKLKENPKKPEDYDDNWFRDNMILAIVGLTIVASFTLLTHFLDKKNFFL